MTFLKKAEACDETKCSEKKTKTYGFIIVIVVLIIKYFFVYVDDFGY